MSIVDLGIRMAVLMGCGVGFGGAVKAGVVTDPVGDASGHADVVFVSARFANENLHLEARFAGGTLNATNVGFIWAFDVDRNMTTGIQPPAAFPLGAEISAYFNSAANRTHASLSGPWPQTDLLVTFSSNALSLSIPLASLGSSDGVMGFGFVVGEPSGTNGFLPYDTAPDSAWEGPLSGITSPVPELSIHKTGATVIVSWDERATNCVLETAASLSSDAVWTSVTNQVTTADGEASITHTGEAESRFFRMRL